jgi:hypothetical protein
MPAGSCCRVSFACDAAHRLVIQATLSAGVELSTAAKEGTLLPLASVSHAGTDTVATADAWRTCSSTDWEAPKRMA